uniref:Uncharacterized protein n=1 Tax=Meloidogyne enterolobii TaxID=390850 RepID=A0A6V7VRG8_MELEN|nr:unnamed protein product [Meloidogyne enterolobii]
MCRYFIDNCGDLFGILLKIVYNVDDYLNNNIVFDNAVNDLNGFLHFLNEELSILSSEPCQYNNQDFLNIITNSLDSTELKANLLSIIRNFKTKMMARNEEQLEPCIALIFELNKENEDVYKNNDLRK